MGIWSFERGIDGRWICHSGCHSGIRVPPCGKKDEKGSGSLLLHLSCLFNSRININPPVSYFSKTLFGIFTVDLSLSFSPRPCPSTDWSHNLQLGPEISSRIHGSGCHFRRTYWINYFCLFYFGRRIDNLEDFRRDLDLHRNFDRSKKERINLKTCA